VQASRSWRVTLEGLTHHDGYNLSCLLLALNARNKQCYELVACIAVPAPCRVTLLWHNRLDAVGQRLQLVLSLSPFSDFVSSRTNCCWVLSYPSSCL